MIEVEAKNWVEKELNIKNMMVRISGKNRNRNSCSDSTKGKYGKIVKVKGALVEVVVVAAALVVVVVAVVVVVGVQGSYHRKTLECSY